MRYIIFLSLLHSFFFVRSQSIAINTDGSSADSSAMLDVKSSAKGILIPRMSTTQRSAVVNPALGLLVFDTTTTSLWFYGGSNWFELKGIGTPNLWQANNNGVYYTSGKVGIGTTPDQVVPLTIFMPNSGLGHATLHLKSNDTWHTGLTMFNGDLSGVANKYYSLLIAGTANTNLQHGSFGLLNHQTSTWSFNFHPTTNYMAVGSTSAFNSNAAKSRLHVFAGDVNIDQIGSGIIMKSPNGNCWRITIDNAGNLIKTAITCP